jgi:hypothetical protein
MSKMAEIQARFDQLETEAIAATGSDALDLAARVRKSGYYELAKGQILAGASDRVVLNLLKRGMIT